MREIRRQTRVVGSFPHGQSAVNLAGQVMLMNGETGPAPIMPDNPTECVKSQIYVSAVRLGRYNPLQCQL